MREASSEIIELQGIEAPVCEALVAAMHGDLKKCPQNLLPSLLVAADSHQVRT